MGELKYLRKYIDLDSYQHNIKKERQGQGKVEARGDKCKIFININNVKLEKEDVLKAYLFKYDKGTMITVFLGTLEIKHNIGKLKITTDRSNIMDSGFSIDDFAGIVILKKDYITQKIKKDQNYGGTWDKNININIYKVKDYKDKNIIETEEKTTSIGTKQIQRKDKINNIEANKKDDTERDIIDEIEEKKLEREDADKIEDDKNIENDMEIDIDNEEEIKTNIKTDEDNKNNKRAEKNHESSKEKLNERANNANKSDIGFEQFGIEEEYYSAFEDETPPEELFENQLDENQLKVLHSKMFKEYPKMAPFEKYEDVLDCIRIEPKDIAALPIDVWMMMNNTFLLNGYHKYKHLILLKVEDDCNNGYKYLLGVPGIYHKKDRFVAYLYGFSKFRCCADTYPKAGEYGYWTVDIGNNM
ncbi:MAG: DUF6128 domain-containing protein [Eubacteriales bacterium]